MLRYTFFSALCLILLAASFSLIQAHSNREPVVTIITGLWDIKRGQMKNNRRSFDYYLDFFSQLLQTNANLIIFGDDQLQLFVQQHRNHTNTIFINKNLSWFQQQWYTPKMKNVIDYHLAIPEHLFYKEYVQYQIEMYNPVLFSKLFLMTEALSYDPYNSDYFVWMDAGLTHVENKTLFIPNNVLEQFPIYFQGPWVHHSLPGIVHMRHGFKADGLRYVKNRMITDFVWGGYYGGRIEAVTTVKSIFENIVRITLEQNEMWTEQNIYSIMVQRYPYMISYVNNLELKHLGNITFHNMHTPPRIDTIREFILDVDQPQHTLAVVEYSSIPSRLSKYVWQMKLEVGESRRLFDSLGNQQFVSLIVQSVIFGVMVVVYLQVRRRAVQIRQWLVQKDKTKFTS